MERQKAVEDPKHLRPLVMPLILFLALTLRLTALYFLLHHEFPDSSVYHQAGRELFSKGQMSTDIYMPLYPLFCGITHTTLGIKLLDVLFSTLTVWILYRLTQTLFNREGVSIIAALLCAIYPFFIFYSVSVLTETSYMFFLLSSILLFYRKRFALASFCFVLSILIRPTLDVLAPLLVFLFSWKVHRFTVKKSFIYVLLYGVIYVAVMSSWWFHQTQKYGRWVRLNLGDGIVWYAGNNPLNRSGGATQNSPKGRDLDSRVFDGISDPILKNDAMKQAAFDYILRHPAHFVAMAGKKFLRFWRLYPYAAEYEKTFYIWVCLFSFGPVLVFFLIFVFQKGRQRLEDLSPIFLIFIFLTGVHMVLAGSMRYRLPLEPFMILMAAYSLFHFFQGKKHGHL